LPPAQHDDPDREQKSDALREQQHDGQRHRARLEPCGEVGAAPAEGRGEGQKDCAEHDGGGDPTSPGATGATARLPPWHARADHERLWTLPTSCRRCEPSSSTREPRTRSRNANSTATRRICEPPRAGSASGPESSARATWRPSAPWPERSRPATPTPPTTLIASPPSGSSWPARAASSRSTS